MFVRRYAIRQERLRSLAAAHSCWTLAILTLRCQRLASSSRSQITTRMASAATWLTLEASSIVVRWRPSLATAIVTHLVTRWVGTLNRLRQSRPLSSGEYWSGSPAMTNPLRVAMEPFGSGEVPVTGSQSRIPLWLLSGFRPSRIATRCPLNSGRVCTMSAASAACNVRPTLSRLATDASTHRLQAVSAGLRCGQERSSGSRFGSKNTVKRRLTVVAHVGRTARNGLSCQPFRCRATAAVPRLCEAAFRGCMKSHDYREYRQSHVAQVSSSELRGVQVITLSVTTHGCPRRGSKLIALQPLGWGQPTPRNPLEARCSTH